MTAKADPLNLPLEELLYLRLGRFLDQLEGRKIPELYRVLQTQMDRAVLKQALERSGGQLNEAASFLGVDRNTLSRKVNRLGLNGAPPGETAPKAKVKRTTSASRARPSVRQSR